MGGPGSGPQPGYRRPKPHPVVAATDDGTTHLTDEQKQQALEILRQGGDYENVCKILLVPRDTWDRHRLTDPAFLQDIETAWMEGDKHRVFTTEVQLHEKAKTGDTRAMENILNNLSKDRWAPATKLPQQVTNIGTMNVLSSDQSLQEIQSLEARLLKRKELPAARTDSTEQPEPTVRRRKTSVPRSEPSEPEVFDAEVVD